MGDVQRKVSLVFDADISKAKSAMNDLYGTLNKISSMQLGRVEGQMLSKDINEAAIAAAHLKVNLESAVNVDTGKLDLKKFNSNLQKSKMSLQDYQRILMSCGPAGKQAFTQLAQSIITADTKVIHLSDKLKDLGVTLANTAKWQLSSNIMHGIESVLSNAYNYAKDLNKSLNDIRIVTSKSVGEMKDFAAEANKAAQALSTTTTEYSDASLIFFQQGLKDDDVKQRTEAVIKLASVTGETASQVSDYMTAIWNNFSDGTIPLEHYADVLTKLGAATASSSEEIAGGLEKFSAVAKTIGLSYEYAASALATITAQTRQSEDVVGTALKTIFARIQGLQLGETLEDGVTLNKYSEALKTVGVSIFESNGELRKMDNILDELGSKWGTLSKAEQTALAQTVAGVRQYNQLMALMDNWSDFEVNVDMSVNADGSLDEQYEIYTQSWEAASKRMKAAMEDVYDSLINDEAMIALTDFFTDFIQSISASIDSIGGLQGVLLLLSSVLLKVFSPQIGQFIDSITFKFMNLGSSLKAMITGSQTALEQQKQDAANMLGNQYRETGTAAGILQGSAADEMGSLSRTYLLNIEKLAPYEKQIAESMYQRAQSLNEAVISQGELTAAAEKEYKSRLSYMRAATTVRDVEVAQQHTSKDDKNKPYVFNRGEQWQITSEDKDGKVTEIETQAGKDQKAALTYFKEKTNTTINMTSTGFTMKNEQDVLTLQKAALDEYNKSLQQSTILQEAFVKPSAYVQENLIEFKSLGQAVVDLGTAFSMADDKSKALANLDDKINSAPLKEFQNSIETSAKYVDELETSVKKQGKTLKDVFGATVAENLTKYKKNLNDVKTAYTSLATASKKVADLEKQVNSTKDGPKKVALVTELEKAQNELVTATKNYQNAQNQLDSEEYKDILAQVQALEGKVKQARDALLGLGYSEDQLQKLENACREAGVSFTDLVAKTIKAKDASENARTTMDGFSRSSMTAGKVLSNIASVASQVAMGFNAIKGLKDIWSNEDLSAGEKVLSTLMNLSTLLPLVGQGIDFISTSIKIRRYQQAAANVIDEAELANIRERIGLTAQETTGLWAKAVAWAAAHPILAATIGVAAVAAVIGLMVAMSNTDKEHTKVLEKKAEATKKVAESSAKAADKAEEEKDAIIDLSNQYDELYEKYRNQEITKSEFIDTTSDLIEKFKIEDGQLLLLQGHYDELNTKIKETLKLKAQEQAQKAQQSSTDTMDATQAALDASGASVSIGLTQDENGLDRSAFTFDLDPETDKWFIDYINKHAKEVAPWHIEGNEFKAYYTDNNQIAALYDQFNTIFSAALAAAGGAQKLDKLSRTNGIYKTYQHDMIGGGDEASAQVPQAIDVQKKAQESDFESYLYQQEVESAKDYEEAKQQWIDNQVKQYNNPQDQEMMRTYYEDLLKNMTFTNTQFIDFRNANTAQSSQIKALENSQVAGDSAAIYNSLVQQYGEDAVLRTTIDSWMDINDVKKAIKETQNQINQNDLQLTVDMATQGLEAFEKVKNQTDYNNWWNEYGERALKDTGYTKESFMLLRPEDQKKILQKQANLLKSNAINGRSSGASSSNDRNDTDTEQSDAEKAEEFYTGEVEKWYQKHGSYYNADRTRAYQFKEQDYYYNIIDTADGKIIGGNEDQDINQISLDTFDQMATLVTKTDQGLTKAGYEELINDFNMAYLYGDTELPKFLEKYGENAYSQMMAYAYERYNGPGALSSDPDRVQSDLDLLFAENGAFTWYADKTNDATVREKTGFNTQSELDAFYAQGTQLEQQVIQSQVEQEREKEAKHEEAKNQVIEQEWALREQITDSGLDIDAVYQLADSIKEVSQDSDVFSKNLKYNDIALKQVAKQLSRYNRAVETASDKMEIWKETLSSDDLAEQIEVINELKSVYADMFDLDTDDFSDEFLKSADNIELMEKALSGSKEAYDALQAVIAKDMIKDKFNGLSEITDEMINAVTSADIKVGDKASIDIAGNLRDMYNAAAKAAVDGGKNTAQAMAEANALIQAVGYEPPEIEMVETTVTGQLPTGYKPLPYTDYIDSNGIAHTGTDWEPIPGEEYTYTITVPTPKGGAPFIKSSENIGGATFKPKSSGGSSKKTSEARQKKSDTVERYKEINDKIDDITREMEKSSNAADRLWGPARIEQMEKVNDALKEEIELIKDKRKESEYYLQEDKNALDAAAADLGLTFTYDEQGNISNYEDQMTALYNAREALLDSFGSEMNESEQTKLDNIDDRIDTLKEAIDQYDETKELQQDLTTEIQDKINEWQDQNYELLNMKLELTIELNDSQMEVLDYWLAKTENDIYQTVEAFKLLSEQTNLYTSNLEAQSQYFEDLNSEYENGKISLADYKDGLKSAQSAVISNLQSLEEQKTTMQEYYGGVMDMALEKIAMYSDEMSNLTGVLDHYSSILELTGKQNDYLTKNTILKNRANVLKSELQIQKNQYDASVAEAQQWFDKMNSVIEGSNEFETYQKNWQAAQAAANDAQDQMLSKTEEWAEAMKTIIENELAEIAETLEKSLTGGISFDELMTSMERRSSLQEEYLTTTNKIYETNKLMRTAQQEIDKTTNTVAKKRLQGFINETNQLQNQTKLSQYELDIQKAKYDLVLAEIALEEAQNAKSTVRLQRDAEGNFGYVYTADANKVAEAESKLADAQNNLYNIALQGANDYQQKYAETLQESQDAITELTTMWMNGEIASEEEFNRRKMEITEYYGEKLQQYSELHNIALQTDSRVLTEAWSSDFIERTASVETWKNNVKTYFDEAGMQMAAWAEVTKQVLDQSGLSDMDKALGEVNAKHQALLDILLGEDGKSGLIHAMEEQVIKAGEVSEAHIAMQNEISKTTEEYEKLLTAINNANIAMTETKEPTISTEGGEYTPPSDKKADIPGVTSSNTSSGESGGNKDASLIKLVQKALGVEADGIWGKNSKQAAYDQYKTESYKAIAKKLKENNHSDFINLTGFDTGGYTGAWGSYGKMALLHEKELILNAHDTENFLASMEVLERILSIIDLQSLNARLNNSLISPGVVNAKTAETVEQNVHIEASFPGVTNHTEIEEAFTNLVNQASQYANRK